MASSVELTSDETTSKDCSVCKEDNRSTTAAKYCVDCQDYYCSECLKSHKTIPALKRHKRIDTHDEMIDQLLMIPTEKCERHHFKTVDMFCQNHDEVGCATCIAVDHRDCKDVFYIPEMLISRLETEGQKKLDDIENKFKKILKTFSHENTALQTNKQCEIDKINSLVKQIEDKIRQEAKDAISQVEIRYDKLKSSLKENVVKVRDQFVKLSKVKECIETTKQNKSQVFVATKIRKDEIATFEMACYKYSKIELGQRIKFTIDQKYENLCQKEEVLGLVNIQPYNFVHKGSFEIKLSSEKDANVGGLCILSNGSIVLADESNENIKLVCGTTLKVIDHHRFHSAPTDVCRAEGNEIAVCLQSESKISLFNVNSKFYQKYNIDLEFSCKGLFCKDNIFYISGENTIQLTDLTGKVLKTIQVNAAESSHSFYYVFVSKESGKIFASDSNQDKNDGVVTFDKDGNLLSKPSYEILWPHQLADAGNGKVFVCGHCSRNVVLLNERGEFEKVVITDGLLYPQALCFNNKKGRLYVSNYSSNQVEIFESD